MILIPPYWDNTVWIEPIATPTQGHALYQAKELLVLAGWEVKSSGDGVSVFSATGDVITSGVVMDEIKAWYRISSPEFDHLKPDGTTEKRRIEITRQTIQPSKNSNPTVRIKVNLFGKGQNYFTGGAPDFRTTPSAVDEFILLGGGDDANPTGDGWYQNAGASSPNYLTFGSAETTYPFRSVFSGISHNSPHAAGSNICIDALQNLNPDDHEIHMHYSTTQRVNSGWDRAFFESDTTLSAACYAVLDDQMVRVFGAECKHGNADIDLNTFAPKHPLVPGYFARYSDLAAPNGNKGFSKMLYRLLDRFGYFQTPYTYQINTEQYGDYSFFGRGYNFPWPAKTKFTAFRTWDEYDATVIQGDTNPQKTTYRMSGFDVSLGKLVFWLSESVDIVGNDYGGSGPIENAAIHAVL